MHFHFVFSADEIIWTLSFAAELVLMVVLLGRDRARRFPCFMASMVAVTLVLLFTKLLFNRVSQVTANEVFYGTFDASALVGLLVVIELARRAFRTASAWAWNVGAGLAVLVTCTVMVFWGPWPAWKTLAGHSLAVVLRDMQMFADKGSLLDDLLYVELGLAIVLFGRRFGAGWRSHAQMIAIGLSTAALSQLAIRLIWQLIATRTSVHGRAQFDRLMALRQRMYHANAVVYLCVLVWWIGWLWLDEPGAPTAAAAEPDAPAKHLLESSRDPESSGAKNLTRS